MTREYPVLSELIALWVLANKLSDFRNGPGSKA